jgi:acetyl esterase/lipase
MEPSSGPASALARHDDDEAGSVAACLRSLMTSTVQSVPDDALASKIPNVVSSASSASDVIDECVRRLRAAGDGGESGMDKNIHPHVAFRTVPARADSFFLPWSDKDGHLRGNAEWALGKQRSSKSEDRIVYVHGGGFEWYAPSDEFYRPQTARLAQMTGLPVLGVDYRLAPAHKFPDPLVDVLNALAYAWKFDPSGKYNPARSVFLVGDSAGGGLVLSSCVALLSSRTSPEGTRTAPGGVKGSILDLLASPSSMSEFEATLESKADMHKLPTKLVAISPYLDLTASLPTYKTRAFDESTLSGDPVFSTGGQDKSSIESDIAQTRAATSRFLLPGADPANPLYSPMFASASVLRQLPPILIIVGDAELMLGESLEFAARAVEAGVSHDSAEGVSLRVFPRMWHCFPFYLEACGQKGQQLQEAKKAYEEIRNYITDALPNPVATEDIELKQDVYATAFLLATNASPTMYTIHPLRNPQMQTVWAFTLFILVSQLFAIAMLTILQPTAVASETNFVNCDMPTAGDVSLLSRILPGVADIVVCPEKSTGEEPATCNELPRLSPEAMAYCVQLEVTFVADVGGKATSFRRLESEVLFFKNVFKGSPALIVLQIICCSWVAVHLYFEEVKQVERMFKFRDFNRWHLPLKREELIENSVSVMAIPCLQFVLAVSVLSVSCVTTCAQSAAFDVVLNSLAFTFISEIPMLFSKPVLKYYTKTPIRGLDPEEYGTDPIYYLVGEYASENAYDDEKQWVHSWYIKESWQFAGLISDFHVRHDPNAYEKIWSPRIWILKAVFWGSLFAGPIGCWLLWS